ncbi:MAG TPA: iron-sulfur cluster repair di-iron protein [Vicinamibacterales bacterium]|nr:iron-sulfur cluster repair di-iron protein [Vicinamibacterales bacterium]
MHFTGDSTIGDIVAEDFRTAAVFQQFGIDFCCGGRHTLAEACRERNADPEAVLAALTRSCSAAGTAPKFDAWSPETLIGYVVGTHHAYVRRALPTLLAHTRKLAAAHGTNHPELHEVMRLVEQVAGEMTSHMAKEEQILFPYIAEIAEAADDGRAAPRAPFGSIDNPIAMMEREHEDAGAAMAEIRRLTGGYTVPADGCTTYRVTFRELEAFESDLHTHVHLENNILFPKARRLAEGRRA